MKIDSWGYDPNILCRKVRYFLLLADQRVYWSNEYERNDTNEIDDGVEVVLTIQVDSAHSLVLRAAGDCDESRHRHAETSSDRYNHDSKC